MKKFNLKLKKKLDNFFDWIKGAELVELQTCNVDEDPVRPELDIKFRTEYGRKIYGVKYIGSIRALTIALMVFSTAFGTAVFGILIDYGFSIERIAFISGAYIIISWVLLIIFRHTLEPVKLSK